MISYLMNPKGDVVWECAHTGKSNYRRLLRIDLGHYLEIVAHTTEDEQRKRRLWTEGTLEAGHPGQWAELERARKYEEGTHDKFRRQAAKVAAAIATGAH